MKRINWILFLLIAGLLVFSGAGCKKKAAQRPQTLEEGVEQLRAALINANPEVQSNLYSRVSYNIRYGNYFDALTSLDQIASDPSLNEQQKRLVNDVIELLKPKVQSQNKQ